MATLYEQHQDTFKERILPDVDELETFWNAMEDNPQLRDHPVLNRRDWKRRAIPLVLHGDGVPLTGIGKSWSKLVDVLFGIVSSRSGVYSFEDVFDLCLFCFAVRSC